MFMLSSLVKKTQTTPLPAMSTNILPDILVGFENDKFKKSEKRNSTLSIPFPPPHILTPSQGYSPPTVIFYNS